jgi:hypothetical protein
LELDIQHQDFEQELPPNLLGSFSIEPSIYPLTNNNLIKTTDNPSSHYLTTQDPHDFCEKALLTEMQVAHDGGNKGEQLKKNSQGPEDLWSQDERLSNHENMSPQRVKLLNDSQGNIYEGDLVDGKKQGQGKQIFQNGDLYQGSWVANKMEGQGKYTSNNGNEFIGEFKNGVLQGEAIKIFKETGDVYHGEFQNFKMIGKGLYKYAQDSKQY